MDRNHSIRLVQQRSDGVSLRGWIVNFRQVSPLISRADGRVASFRDRLAAIGAYAALRSPGCCNLGAVRKRTIDPPADLRWEESANEDGEVEVVVYPPTRTSVIALVLSSIALLIGGALLATSMSVQLAMTWVNPNTGRVVPSSEWGAITWVALVVVVAALASGARSFAALADRPKLVVGAGGVRAPGSWIFARRAVELPLRGAASFEAKPHASEWVPFSDNWVLRGGPASAPVVLKLRLVSFAHATWAASRLNRLIRDR